MDWKVLAIAFGSVFLAELGDKTMLATFGLSAGSASRWSVFVGAAAALVCTTALSVLGADLVTRYVPLAWVQRGAGALLVVVGALLLLGRE